MWPSITAVLKNSAMSFAPLMYWIVFGAAMAFYCIKYPRYRNKISSICLLACVFGIVASILSILAIAWDVNYEQSTYFFFYGLYITFAFLPSIFAFYIREKRTRQSNAGKYTTYAGFLWAAACILGGLATTIMSAILLHQDSSDDRILLSMLSGGLFFVILMNWGFVVALLLLTLIYFKRLPQKHARSSFLAYVMLQVIATTAFTILGFAPFDFNFFTIDTLGYLTIFLEDLPVTISVFVAFHMAHLWIDDSPGNLISNDAHDTQVHQTQYNNETNTNINDDSKYELSNSV